MLRCTIAASATNSPNAPQQRTLLAWLGCVGSILKAAGGITSGLGGTQCILFVLRHALRVRLHGHGRRSG